MEPASVQQEIPERSVRADKPVSGEPVSGNVQQPNRQVPAGADKSPSSTQESSDVLHWNVTFSDSGDHQEDSPGPPYVAPEKRDPDQGASSGGAGSSSGGGTSNLQVALGCDTFVLRQELTERLCPETRILFPFPEPQELLRPPRL
jgi:hypothetical protein